MNPLKRINIPLLGPYLFSYLLLFVFIVCSNYFDWDFFYSTFEVDLRSWLNDHHPPFWSYQLCAGSTRIGDPQSFGFSPLFLFVIIFGSFWGTKIMVFSSFIVGHIYLYRVLCLVNENTDLRRFNLNISFLTVFSNFFLWQLHHGHITMLLNFYSIGIIYYSIKFSIEDLQRKEFAVMILLLFTVLTSGFYHSLMFLLLPVLSIFFIFILLTLTPKKIIKISLAYILGLALSSYRWLPAIFYQSSFPRSIEAAAEGLNWADIFSIIFSPTIDYNYLWGKSDHLPYGIWEYSSFSIVAYFFLIVLMTQKNIIKFVNNNLKLFILISSFTFFGLLLIIGDFGKYSPYSVIQLLTSNSMRVVGRYSVVILLGLSMLTVFFVRNSKILNIFLKYKSPYVITILIASLNLISFEKTLSLESLKYFTKLKKPSVTKMNSIAVAKFRSPMRSFMYPEILAGHVVPNCYQPLNRSTVFMSEYPKKPWELTTFGIIKKTAVETSKECHGNTYLTQNDIVISKECPKDMCLYLNSLNIYNDDYLQFKTTGNVVCKK